VHMDFLQQRSHQSIQCGVDCSLGWSIGDRVAWVQCFWAAGLFFQIFAVILLMSALVQCTWLPRNDLATRTTALKFARLVGVELSLSLDLIATGKPRCSMSVGSNFLPNICHLLPFLTPCQQNPGTIQQLQHASVVSFLSSFLLQPHILFPVLRLLDHILVVPFS